MADYSSIAIDSSVSAVNFGLLFGTGNRDAERSSTDAGGVNISSLFSNGDKDSDRPGFLDVSGIPVSGVRTADRNVSRPVVVTATYYLMRAVDPDAQTLTYRTWVVAGNPDTSGAQYTGTKSGNSALTNIVVMATWSA